MADTKQRAPRPSPPITLTRDNAIANLKLMMPPPGYSEGGGGEAAGEPNKNIPGGNIGGTHGYDKSWSSDYTNAARPPAPPPYLSPRAPISPQGPPPVNLEQYHSPQARSGYGEDSTKFDPRTNPSGFLTGDQYRAIPPSVPAPVRTYMGNNPTTDMKRGGVVKVKKYDDGGPADNGMGGLGAASNQALSHPPPPVIVGPKVTYPTGQSDQLGVVPRGFTTPPPSPGAVRMQQSNPNLAGRAGGRTMGAIVKPKPVNQEKGGPVKKEPTKSGWRKYGW